MYFPDYRHETEKLNDVDRAYIGGYRHAVEDVGAFFANLPDDLLSVEKEVIERVRAELAEWVRISETDVVCALFDMADYLPQSVFESLVDANEIHDTEHAAKP